MSNQYSDRDPMQLDLDGGHYSRHTRAMTKEGLHSKVDIAMELAYRDREIENLKGAVLNVISILNQDEDDERGFACPRSMFKSHRCTGDRGEGCSSEHDKCWWKYLMGGK